MEEDKKLRLAIVYPGDREARRTATHDNNRFSDLFAAFTARGIDAEPAVYHDDFCEDVREQLSEVDGALVWINPIQGGVDRTMLDSMLREVAAAGLFVSTHPDVILKLGTKEVLYRTRDIGWGSDTHLYIDLDQMRRELPERLASGEARVIKRNRGNGGDGVWKVQFSGSPDSFAPFFEDLIAVRHAKRGCVEEQITLQEFLDRCGEYFEKGGCVIDQKYQERLPEGMIRCYLVHNKVAGFGHQAVNALFPAGPGEAPEQAPQPGPRLYHPPNMPEFQALKEKLEREWVPRVQRLLKIDDDSLPVLWDCDFLLGPKDVHGEDTYVICEINVSSVAPLPDSAIPFIVETVETRLRVRQEA